MNNKLLLSFVTIFLLLAVSGYATSTEDTTCPATLEEFCALNSEYCESDPAVAALLNESEESLVANTATSDTTTAESSFSTSLSTEPATETSEPSIGSLDISPASVQSFSIRLNDAGGNPLGVLDFKLDTDRDGSFADESSKNTAYLAGGGEPTYSLEPYQNYNVQVSDPNGIIPTWTSSVYTNPGPVTTTVLSINMPSVVETDNTCGSARALALDNTASDELRYSGDQDWWTLNLPSGGDLTFAFTDIPQTNYGFRFKLYDSCGSTSIDDGTSSYSGDLTHTISGLSAGTYYVQVLADTPSYQASAGDYTLRGTLLQVVCYTNSDCGDDGYDYHFCGTDSNIRGMYRTYTCNNAGTASAFCSDDDTDQIISDCVSAGEICTQNPGPTYSCEPVAPPACTPHAYPICQNNDEYWVDSCGVTEELKQDCGTDVAGAWGRLYCDGSDLRHNRTYTYNGCTGTPSGACYTQTVVQGQIDSTCAANEVCIDPGTSDAYCSQVACITDSDCPGTAICSSNKCVEPPRVELYGYVRTTSGMVPDSTVRIIVDTDHDGLFTDEAKHYIPGRDSNDVLGYYKARDLIGNQVYSIRIEHDSSKYRAQELTVTLGDTMRRQDFTLSENPRLFGYVKDASNQPIEGLHVRADRNHDTLFNDFDNPYAATNAEGYYSMPLEGPATHIIQFNDPLGRFPTESRLVSMGASNSLWNVVIDGTSPSTGLCSSDSDCPSDTYAGSTYCANGNVKQEYRDYSCVDAGTSSSRCEFQVTEGSIQTCSASELCIGGSNGVADAVCHAVESNSWDTAQCNDFLESIGVMSFQLTDENDLSHTVIVSQVESPDVPLTGEGIYTLLRTNGCVADSHISRFEYEAPAPYDLSKVVGESARSIVQLTRFRDQAAVGFSMDVSRCLSGEEDRCQESKITFIEIIADRVGVPEIRIITIPLRVLSEWERVYGFNYPHVATATIVDDATVRQNTPSNVDNGEFLYVGLPDGTDTEELYVKLDSSSVPSYVDIIIDQAQLALYGSEFVPAQGWPPLPGMDPADAELRIEGQYVDNAAWQEESLTWANKPGSFGSGMSNSALYVSETSRWHLLDITSLFKPHVSTLNSVVIKPTLGSVTQGSAKFWSKENSDTHLQPFATVSYHSTKPIDILDVSVTPTEVSAGVLSGGTLQIMLNLNSQYDSTIRVGLGATLYAPGHSMDCVTLNPAYTATNPAECIGYNTEFYDQTGDTNIDLSPSESTATRDFTIGGSSPWPTGWYGLMVAVWDVDDDNLNAPAPSNWEFDQGPISYFFIPNAVYINGAGQGGAQSFFTGSSSDFTNQQNSALFVDEGATKLSVTISAYPDDVDVFLTDPTGSIKFWGNVPQAGVEYYMGLDYETIIINNPAPGEWLLEVAPAIGAPSTIPVPTYAYAVEYPDHLSTKVSDHVYDVNALVELEARFVSGRDVLAEIQKPTGELQVIPLTDSGTGTYTATFTASDTAGVYSATIRGTSGSTERVDQLKFAVDPRPDLVLTNEDIQVVGSLLKDETQTVSVTVTNSGTAEAKIFHVTTYEGTPSQGTRFGAFKETVPLAIGESRTYEFNWTPLAESEYELHAAVDIFELVPEFNEDNNEGSKSVIIAPDSSVSLGVTVQKTNAIPLSNLKVDLLPENGAVVDSQFTNDNGEVTFTNLQAGRYKLRTKHYAQTFTSDFIEPEFTPEFTMTIPIQPVTVTVEKLGGSLMPGWVIAQYGGGEITRVFATPEGQAFFNLPPATYTFQIKQDGLFYTSDLVDTSQTEEFTFTIQSPSYVPSADGTIATLSLDEGTGEQASDSAGENHGTLHGAAWVPGFYSNALSFDGIDDYVDLGGNPVLSPEAITIAAWVKPSSGSSTDQVIVQRKSDSATNYVLALSPSNEPYFKVFVEGFALQGTQPWSAPALDPGVWHHVVGTYAFTADGQRDYVELYVDGVRVASQGVNDLGYQTIRHFAGVPTRISDPSAPFNGVIDDLHIYNKKLTVAEISNLHTNAVTVLELDEGSGGITKDFAGSNDGTIHGATWVDAPSSKALSFDGVDDYLDLGSDSSLSPEALSVSAWVKPTASGGMQTIVQRKGVVGSKEEVNYKLELVGGRPSFKVWVHGFGLQGPQSWASPTLTTGEWHHVVGTYAFTADGQRDEVVLYVDGVRVASQSITDLGYQTIRHFSNMRTTVSDLSTSFNGSIDTVRIYNRKLSAVEVQNRYSAS